MKSRVQFNQYILSLESYKQVYGYYPNFDADTSPGDISFSLINPPTRNLFIEVLSAKPVYNENQVISDEAMAFNRKVMDAETTFSEALDLSVKGKSYYRDFGLQRSLQTAREEYLIIYNLIDFRLHFTSRDAKGSLQHWDAEKDFIFGGPEGNVGGGYLVYVDIEIKVLNPSGLDSSSPTKNNSKTLERDQLLLSEAQRYYRRVVFPSYPF